MYSPLILGTTTTLLGMLSIKSLQTDCRMASHFSFSSLSYKILPSGETSSKLPQVFPEWLIGLTSGDCSDYGKTWNLLFLNHFLTSFAGVFGFFVLLGDVCHELCLSLLLFSYPSMLFLLFCMIDFQPLYFYFFLMYIAVLTFSFYLYFTFH